MLEFLTASLNIVIFAHTLMGANQVVIEADAYATPLVLANKASADDMAVVDEILRATPEYRMLTEPKPRLSARHVYGAGNPLPDAISRGKMEVFRSLCEAIGVRATDIGIGERGAAFLDTCLDAIEADRALRAAHRVRSSGRAVRANAAAGDHAKPPAENTCKVEVAGSQHDAARGPRSQTSGAAPGKRQRDAGRQLEKSYRSNIGGDGPPAGVMQSAEEIDTRPRLSLAQGYLLLSAAISWRGEAARAAADTQAATAGAKAAKAHLERTVRPRCASSYDRADDMTRTKRASNPRHASTDESVASFVRRADGRADESRSIRKAIDPSGGRASRPACEARPAVAARKRAVVATQSHSANAARVGRARRAPEAARSRAEVEATWALSNARLVLAKKASGDSGPGGRRSAAHEMKAFLMTEYTTKVNAVLLQLRADKSSLALRPIDEELLRSLLLMAASSTVHRTPDSTAGHDRSYWRFWMEWCATMGTSPLRTNVAANRAMASEAENAAELSLRMGAFMLWVVCNPRFQPDSMLARLRGVARVHKALGYDFGPLSQVTQACRGATQRYIEEHGQDAIMPKRKEPLTNAILCAVMALPFGIRVGAYTVGSSLDWLGVRVFNALMAKSGFRKAEVALDSDVQFGKRHLSLYNVRWWIGGRWVERPTAAMQAAFTSADRVHIIPPPSKADQDGRKWAASQVVSRFNPGDPLNLFCELATYEVVRTVDGSEIRQLSPLLLAAGGGPWRKSALDALFSALMVLIVGPEAAKRYSVHSYRIYLACALRAAGAGKELIMEMLRWSSEDALKLYARINSVEDAALRDAAAVATIDSVRSGTLLREALPGDTALRRADLLDATAKVDLATVDMDSVPTVDIDRPVQQLSERIDALDSAARRQDELTAADHPASLDGLLAELRS